MPKNAFSLRTRNLLVSQKTTQRHFIFTLHPLSTVIFATATVLAFVLLRNSSFNFHCYTQHEATPTQKSARKCTATSRDFFAERLQSAFTLANQLRWIAQYTIINHTLTHCQIHYILSSTTHSHIARSIYTVQTWSASLVKPYRMVDWFRGLIMPCWRVELQ